MILLRTILLLAILGQLYLAIALWPDLPALIPTHFDAAGCPDGWADRDKFEWFLVPGLLAIAGIVCGYLLPAISIRMAQRNSSWLNVPQRERFRQLPESARVRAMREVCGWLLVIGTELQALIMFLVLGTFRVATKEWECLPPVVLYGLVAVLLATAIALAVGSSRAVRREIEKASA